MSTHTLLHDAVLRAASLQNPLSSPTAPNSDQEDSVLTRVHSPLTSPPNLSRPGSPPPPTPTKTGNSSRNQSRVGLRQKREAAALAKLCSRDPLRRLPTDVAIRIFTIVGLGADGCGGQLDGATFSAVKDLLNCGLVCKKWRTSSTINYVWYKLFHQTSYNQSIEKEFGPLTWTRKDSKTDWSSKYRELNLVKEPRSIGFLEEEDSRGPSEKELKEAEWRAEEERGEQMTKAEARAFYKELGGRKLKAKTGKGWGSDRTGWEERELFS